MTSSNGLKSVVSPKVEDALEEREQRIIQELIKSGIIEKTIHPYSKQIIYVIGNEDKTDEVEEFAGKIARLKSVKVKLQIGGRHSSHD